ncbi:MAG: hypothetical protein KAQ98_11640 [Bacteriovoracaceae bacterium]|nr:hypothetical protein [Bacteriovoracaceae bacterium]
MKQKNPELKRFYIIGFIPFVVFYLVLSLFDVILLNKLFFSLAYIWNMFLLTPGACEKISSRRYRIAFVRFVFWINNTLQSKLNGRSNPWLAILLRTITPFLFVVILYLIALRGNILFVLLGSFLFESCYMLSGRFFPGKKEISL